MTEAVRSLIAQGLADPEATWSLGGFGALATFARTPDEPVTWLGTEGTGLVTPRGGIALRAAQAIPVAYETAFSGGWSHAVALCLPVAHGPRPGHGVVTEAGPDTDALRPANVGDNLFDLGLDLPQGRIALRTGDPHPLEILRSWLGRDALGSGSPIAGLVARSAVDLVVTSPLGRIEVFAGAGGPGPRGFLVPRLLALGRTHAATAPIPEGLVPVASLNPAHPCRDGVLLPPAFDGARHAAFQALLTRWGPPDLVALKARLVAGTAQEGDSATRRMRNVARVVRAQAEAMATGPNHDAGKS